MSIRLDKELSHPIKGVWFNPRLRTMIKSGKWDGRQHFYNRINGKFHTGLLPMVQSFTAFGKGDQLIDNRFPSDYSFLEAIERAKQLTLNGIEFSGFQRESIVNNVKAGRALNTLATNAGKTEVGIGTVEAIQRPALWLVARKVLLRQVAERYKLRTGGTAGMIGEGKFTIGERLTVGSVQSLLKAYERDKNFFKQFQTLIVDECQHGQAKTWFQLAMKCPAPFRFGLSGSLPTDPIKRLRIMSITSSEIVANVRNAELIESGWSAKPKVHLRVFQYPENTLSYRTAYDKMIRSHNRYNDFVVCDAEYAYKRGKIVLVIVDRIKQGTYITSNLIGRGVPAKFISGGTDDEYREKVIAAFKSGKTQVIVGTSVFDEGVDVPAIETLILAPGGKSDQRQLQRVGRGLRKKEDSNEVEIYDYIHAGNVYLLAHSLARLALYEGEGFEIVWEPEIELDL